jgi:hypothetical protein
MKCPEIPSMSVNYYLRLPKMHETLNEHILPINKCINFSAFDDFVISCSFLGVVLFT